MPKLVQAKLVKISVETLQSQRRRGMILIGHNIGKKKQAFIVSI